MVRTYLKEKHNIDIGRSQVINWIHAIGFSMQRRRKKYSKQDPEKQDAFVDTLKKLQNQQPDEAILFLDEAGIQLDPTIAAQWAPKGCQPQLFSDSTRERVNLCGVVDINTMDAMVQKIPKSNAENFISSMQWLRDIYPTYSRIWLYVDNARWHNAQKVKDYLAQQDTIVLNFFPPYSPELNPMEWKWHELRRETTHTRRFQSSDECWQSIQQHFGTRKGKNKHFLCQLN